MKKKYCVAAALIALSMLMAGSAVTTHADPSDQSKGNSALQLSGGFIHAQGADVGTLNLDVGYGFFVSDNWEIGVLQTLGYSFIDDADDDWLASTIPYLHYNIHGLSLNDTFQPFIGAFAGASYNKNDVTGTMGPQIGFRAFINERTFIITKYRYEWFFNEMSINEIEDTSSDGNHVITLGVGFVF